jgi:hypothetical protein
MRTLPAVIVLSVLFLDAALVRSQQPAVGENKSSPAGQSSPPEAPLPNLARQNRSAKPLQNRCKTAQPELSDFARKRRQNRSA